MNDKKKFFINNASKHSIIAKYFINFNKNNELCSPASILDGMKPCSYGKSQGRTMRKRGSFYDIPITYNVSNGNNFYNIQYEKRKGNKIILNANLNINNNQIIKINGKILDLTKNELTADNCHRNILTGVLELLANQSNWNRSFTSFLDEVMDSINELFIIKSLGDYVQEGFSVSKIDPTLSNDDNIDIIQSDINGNAMRVGLAGDRLSAYRMIIQKIFFKNINKEAIVGYAGGNDKTKFMIVK
jgi:hypothetical protein